MSAHTNHPTGLIENTREPGWLARRRGDLALAEDGGRRSLAAAEHLEEAGRIALCWILRARAALERGSASPGGVVVIGILYCSH